MLGCAALKELTADTGEIKSMRTSRAARRRGVATHLLGHLLAEAADRGYRSLFLETGSQEFFTPVHRLYVRHGFGPCGPFADYRPDPFSKFFTRAL